MALDRCSFRPKKGLKHVVLNIFLCVIFRLEQSFGIASMCTLTKGEQITHLELELLGTGWSVPGNKLKEPASFDSLLLGIGTGTGTDPFHSFMAMGWVPDLEIKIKLIHWNPISFPSPLSFSQRLLTNFFSFLGLVPVFQSIK